MKSGHWRAVASVAIALLGAGCGAPSKLPNLGASPAEAVPDSFDVGFETSRGPFDVRVRRAWSPLAADRVYELVRRRVWDDIRIFRVAPNFVAQFGLTNDSSVNRAWQRQGLPDEPVIVPNLRGRVSFARGGPETRSLQIFINLKDNTPRLDTVVARGITGYPPFGEVVRGMEVVDSFYSGYGNDPSRRQDSIGVQGNAYLDRVFPLLDRIREARIIRRWNERDSN